jgi:hypothetical protein
MNVKEGFERTNKQVDLIQADMLVSILKVQHSKSTMNYLNSKNTSNTIMPLSKNKNTINEEEKKTYYGRTIHRSGYDCIKIVNDKAYVNVNLNGLKLARVSNAINNDILNFNTVFDIANTNPKNPALFNELFNDFKYSQSHQLNNIQLKLSKQIQCTTNNMTGKYIKEEHDFKIICNSEYGYVRGVRKNDVDFMTMCNFIEVRYLGDNDNIDMDEYKTGVAQVCAVFSFTGDSLPGKAEIIFLLICWLEVDDDRSKLLPYPCYKYHWYSKPDNVRIRPWILSCQIISLDMVHHPAYVIPFNKKGCAWDKIPNNSLPEYISEINFHAIPYERALRQASDDYTSFSYEEQIGLNNMNNMNNMVLVDVNNNNINNNSLSSSSSRGRPTILAAQNRVGRELAKLANLGSEQLPMYLGKEDLNDVYRFILWATNEKKSLSENNDNNSNSDSDDLENNGSESNEDDDESSEDADD